MRDGRLYEMGQALMTFRVAIFLLSIFLKSFEEKWWYCFGGAAISFGASCRDSFDSS